MISVISLLWIQLGRRDHARWKWPNEDASSERKGSGMSTVIRFLLVGIFSCYSSNKYGHIPATRFSLDCSMPGETELLRHFRQIRLTDSFLHSQFHACEAWSSDICYSCMQVVFLFTPFVCCLYCHPCSAQLSGFSQDHWEEATRSDKQCLDHTGAHRPRLCADCERISLACTSKEEWASPEIAYDSEYDNNDWNLLRPKSANDSLQTVFGIVVQGLVRQV